MKSITRTVSGMLQEHGVLRSIDALLFVIVRLRLISEEAETIGWQRSPELAGKHERATQSKQQL